MTRHSYKMKVVTSDGCTFEFDASHSQLLTDMYGCEGVPHLPIHSTILEKLQTGDTEDSWETLCAMLHAADFLNIPEMLDRIGQRMADMLRGRPAEQVREMMSLIL